MENKVTETEIMNMKFALIKMAVQNDFIKKGKEVEKAREWWDKFVKPGGEPK